MVKKNRVYKFGDEKRLGLGVIVINMLVSKSHYNEITTEVVDVEVLFLLRLDIIKEMRAVFYFEKDQLSKKFDRRSVPPVRKMRHLYVEWPVRVILT